MIRMIALRAVMAGALLASAGGCALMPQIALDVGSAEEGISEYDIRKPYQLDSGDRIRVLVFGQPDLSNETRNVLLAAAIFIDLQYFERKG